MFSEIQSPVGNADNEAEVDDVAADVTIRVCSTSAVGVGRDRRPFSPVGIADVIVAIADETRRMDTTDPTVTIRIRRS